MLQEWLHSGLRSIIAIFFFNFFYSPTPNFTSKPCITNESGILLQKEKMKASSPLDDRFTGNIHLDEVMLLQSAISMRDQKPNTFLLGKKNRF